MCSFYVTVVFSWTKNFQEILEENFTAMFSVSCSQMLTLFGKIGQLVYHIFSHVFIYMLFSSGLKILLRCQIIAAVLEVVIMTVDTQIKL